MPRATSSTASVKRRLPLRLASWLLDSPRLAQSQGVKRLAGNLLKHPARSGCVESKSRLGVLLCRDSGNARDRRIGHEMLRQAARAGNQIAQQELSRQAPPR